MISKLNDGSLDQAVETAASSAGAQHFSDLPPPPPPLEASVEEGVDVAKEGFGHPTAKAIEETRMPKEEPDQDVVFVLKAQKRDTETLWTGRAAT
eukprot:g15362.t1